MPASNYLKNVAIVGAAGNSGKFIVEHLLRYGKHKVTALTREDSKNAMPEGVAVKKVNYDDQASLVAALEGQDALVITMNATARGQQAKLIEAAAVAHVKWILPNEFGSDGTNDDLNRDTKIGIPKKADRDLIEKLGQSSWIGIACSFWYEFSLAGGKERYGFDLKNREAVFYGDGSTRINTTTWPQTGAAVAKLLALKIHPDDENDSSPCLEKYRNKFIYISSFTINQREMLDSLMRVTGKTESDWTISYIPAQDAYKQGTDELAKGDMKGFAKLLYSRVFFPDGSGDYGAKYGLDNDQLGLQGEDLDEYTKAAIQLFESGYFDSKY